MATPDELFDSADVEWLKKRDSLVEGHFIERKETFSDPKGIAESISAFANGAAAGGLIVIGASKDGALTGVDRSSAESAKLAQVLNRLASQPRHEPRIKPIDGEQKVLLFIRVYQSPDRVICLTDGSAFQRVMSSDRRLDADQIAELRYLRGERDFELELAEPLAAAQLDAELCVQFQGLLGGETPNPLELDLLNEQLADRRPDGSVHVTNAGELVLGANPQKLIPRSVVRVLRFDGVDEHATVVQDQEFRGSLPRMIPAVLQFLGPLIRNFDFRIAGGQFAKMPEYPPGAWEEAVVNAVVHRSYSRRHSQVEVKLFDDRMIVRSPGGLFRFVEVDRLNAGEVSSTPRNPALMRALKHFKFVRMRSEGNRTMRDEMVKRGLPPPRWNEDERREYVEVTLRNDYEQIKALQTNGAVIDWPRIANDLRDRQFAVYRQKAIRDWRQARAPAPPEVADAAFDLLFDDSVPESEREQIGELMSELALDIIEPRLQARLGRLLSGNSGLSHLNRNRMAEAAQRSDRLVREIVSWVKRWSGASPAQVWLKPQDQLETALEWSFEVLRLRAQREPLLSREELSELLALAQAFGQIRRAGQLEEVITGRRR